MGHCLLPPRLMRRPTGKIVPAYQNSATLSRNQKAQDTATPFTRLVAVPAPNPSMTTSNAFESYKENASESADQWISLAGDREGLAPDLVIPQQPNRRDDEQQLDPSYDHLPRCCRPDLGFAPEESNHREVVQPESSTSHLKPTDKRERGDHPYLAQEMADQITAPSRSEQVGSMKQLTS
ncbi:hypothetical protein Nepgr_024801 [Nepenthes gracilis]|uniref:Uncharacterized protein n=1 Tax=Nepenthes gracilis TaxID=150966 RepID=A0AAD3T4W5_NEPGR|nr:hypothetical protein Nepgr_024801 [Nepenthes gracilis]